jgi:glycosyltransferase involved in cell wall biosynthesis
VVSLETVNISIVIPAKNEAHNIPNCLDAIYQQETSYSLEVIVIDSGSTDGTMEIVRQYPGIKLLEITPEEFGHGKTRNLGAGNSCGDYIVFINADAVPIGKNWLSRLIETFDTDPEIAGVFSRHLPKEGCHLYMARDLFTSMPPQAFIRSQSSAFDFMIFSTVSCAIKRDIWQSFPFADDIIIAEDQDWGKRVLSEGYRIAYQPESSVYHSHNYTAGELYDIKRIVSQSSPRFNNKISAYIIGFILMVGGIKYKFAGDFFFILFNSKNKNLTITQKLKQLNIALKSRIASFRGRYKGWLH